jgi:hypothetical protein
VHGRQPAQEGQLPGDQDRSGHPSQHGYAAKIGHFDRMNVPVPDSRQGSGPQGQAAAHPAQEISERGRNAENQKDIRALSLR